MTVAITGPYTPEPEEVLCDPDSVFRHFLVFSCSCHDRHGSGAKSLRRHLEAEPGKSQLAGDTLKFSPAEGKAIELTAGGISYSFRLDGQNYAMPSGNIAIWRQTSPDSWTTEYRTRSTASC